MIPVLAAVLLASAAAAAPRPASAVPVSTAAAPSAFSIGITTYTVATLYTGDRVRDPFLPPAVGGAPVHRLKPGEAFVVDIHALQLRGIMKDAGSDYALFSMESGTALVLRGGGLYDDRGKRVPGITGHIRIKQKRAELITADKDVQIFSLGEADDGEKADDKNIDPPAGRKDAGSGRSP